MLLPKTQRTLATRRLLEEREPWTATVLGHTAGAAALVRGCLRVSHPKRFRCVNRRASLRSVRLHGRPSSVRRLTVSRRPRCLTTLTLKSGGSRPKHAAAGTQSCGRDKRPSFGGSRIVPRTLHLSHGRRAHRSRTIKDMMAKRRPRLLKRLPGKHARTLVDELLCLPIPSRATMLGQPRETRHRRLCRCAATLLHVALSDRPLSTMGGITVPLCRPDRMGTAFAELQGRPHTTLVAALMSGRRESMEMATTVPPRGLFTTTAEWSRAGTSCALSLPNSAATKVRWRARRPRGRRDSWPTTSASNKSTKIWRLPSSKRSLSSRKKRKCGCGSWPQRRKHLLQPPRPPLFNRPWACMRESPWDPLAGCFSLRA